MKERGGVREWIERERSEVVGERGRGVMSWGERGRNSKRGGGVRY